MFVQRVNRSMNTVLIKGLVRFALPCNRQAGERQLLVGPWLS